MAETAVGAIMCFAVKLTERVQYERVRLLWHFQHENRKHFVCINSSRVEAVLPWTSQSLHLSAYSLLFLYWLEPFSRANSGNVWMEGWVWATGAFKHINKTAEEDLSRPWSSESFCRHHIYSVSEFITSFYLLILTSWLVKTWRFSVLLSTTDYTKEARITLLGSLQILEVWTETNI